MRLLVTGSRDWCDRLTLVSALADAAHMAADVTVIHGGARGADSLADHTARLLGWRTEVYRADWDAHGKRAGFVRNQQMVDTGADACLAFVMPCTSASCREPAPHGSHGATDCMQRASVAGMPIRLYRGWPVVASAA